MGRGALGISPQGCQKFIRAQLIHKYYRVTRCPSHDPLALRLRCRFWCATLVATRTTVVECAVAAKESIIHLPPKLCTAPFPLSVSTDCVPPLCDVDFSRSFI